MELVQVMETYLQRIVASCLGVFTASRPTHSEDNHPGLFEIAKTILKSVSVI